MLWYKLFHFCDILCINLAMILHPFFISSSPWRIGFNRRFSGKLLTTNAVLSQLLTYCSFQCLHPIGLILSHLFADSSQPVSPTPTFYKYAHPWHLFGDLVRGIWHCLGTAAYPWGVCKMMQADCLRVPGLAGILPDPLFYMLVCILIGLFWCTVCTSMPIHHFQKTFYDAIWMNSLWT